MPGKTNVWWLQEQQHFVSPCAPCPWPGPAFAHWGAGSRAGGLAAGRATRPGHPVLGPKGVQLTDLETGQEEATGSLHDPASEM